MSTFPSRREAMTLICPSSTDYSYCEVCEHLDFTKLSSKNSNVTTVTLTPTRHNRKGVLIPVLSNGDCAAGVPHPCISCGGGETGEMLVALTTTNAGREEPLTWNERTRLAVMWLAVFVHRVSSSVIATVLCPRYDTRRDAL